MSRHRRTGQAAARAHRRRHDGMQEARWSKPQGDLDSAAELMRKQGLAKADKKATRVAAEGVIVARKRRPPTGAARPWSKSTARRTFVAREAGFSWLCGRCSRVIAAGQASRPANLAALDASQRSAPVVKRMDEWRRRALIAKIGEKISIRRFVMALVTSPTVSSAPTCTARASARSLALEGGDARNLARDVAMHIAASNPQYISSMPDVPEADVYAKEREILTEQALRQ